MTGDFGRVVKAVKYLPHLTAFFMRRFPTLSTMWFPEFRGITFRRIPNPDRCFSILKCHGYHSWAEGPLCIWGRITTVFLCAGTNAGIDIIHIFLWQTLPITAILSIVRTLMADIHP